MLNHVKSCYFHLLSADSLRIIHGGWTYVITLSPSCAPYVIDRRRSVHFVNIRQQLLETKRGELMDNLVKVCLLESKTSFFFIYLFFLSAKKFEKHFVCSLLAS